MSAGADDGDTRGSAIAIATEPLGATMLICSLTGRVLSPGESLRVLTAGGFTEGVLDAVTLGGTIRVRAGARFHEVPFDDVEAVWRLR